MESTMPEGLEVVFKYAHHSNMLPELNGLAMLKEACNETGVAKYVESAPCRGWTPTTPTHHQSGDLNLPQEGERNGSEDGGVVMTATDLSALNGALEATDVPSRNISSSQQGKRPHPPRKPPTPESFAMRQQLAASERKTLPTAFAVPVVEDEDAYMYRSKTTQGAALQTVFSFAMRQEAQHKVQLVKEKRLPLNSVDSVADDMTPFSGLQALHAACMAVKLEAGYKLNRLHQATWNSQVSRHQRERLVLNMGGLRNPSLGLSRNGSSVEASVNPAAPQPPSSGAGGRPRKRLNTAQRIRTKAQKLQTVLDDVKTMIDARQRETKYQAGLNGGTNARARRLKAFAATIPRPGMKQQQYNPDGTLSATQGSFLPSLNGTRGSQPAGGSGEEAATSAAGSPKSATGTSLPSIRGAQSQTAGSGNNFGHGSKLSGVTSHAGELIRRLEEKNTAASLNAQAAGANPDFDAGESGAAAGGGTITSNRPYLKSVKHRFISGPVAGTAARPPAPASHTAVARKLML